MIRGLIALLCMTATIPSQASFTKIEDESNLPLLNPELQDRKILKLKLDNGLQVLLISDAKADQSAAAVCVSSGSWNDPLEYPGMAHFCEHMLFMGSEKYPSENEFFTMVSNYAGTTNAYTAPNRTVYMFSSQKDGFNEILDRFAHFFIDPLFNPANIAREMHAVDQEFAKNIENDSWREYMIFKETGNKDHPNHLFSTGNSQTLGQIPQSALKTWHSENYGADKMHLTIYSSFSLEELQQKVIEYFSNVPLAKGPFPDTDAPLSSDTQKGHITYIKPIQNRNCISLMWELPKELSDDPTKSAELLAFALQRGQKHSLYEKLKNEKLIDSMNISVDELGGKDHQFFSASFYLTKQGLEKIPYVIRTFFENLAIFKDKAIPNYLFEEKNLMAKINYQYQGRQEPFDFVMKMGDSVADEDLSTFPKNTLLASKMDPKQIQKLLSILKPQTVAINFTASPEVTKVETDRKEKWFGAEYAIRPIPKEWILDWSHVKPSKDIAIASQNPYLPKNLQILPDPNLGLVPVQIANDDFGQAFYARCSQFSAPISVTHLNVLSDAIKSDPKSVSLALLYIDHFTDMIYPTIAEGAGAGLQFQCDLDELSLHFQVSGYSEKAFAFLSEIIQQAPLNPPTKEQFQVYLDRHQKGYMNAQKELAARQAKDLLDSIVNQDKFTKKQKLEALNQITYEDFLKFHTELFKKTYCKALFTGNIDPKTAKQSWNTILKSLGKTAFAKSEHPKTKIMHLPNSGPFLVKETTSAQGNATLLLIEEGGFTFKKRAAQELVSSALKEAFFNELRTKQKTGYIAMSDHSEIEERLFQFFLVQSNSHQPEDLLYRFEQFIEEFSDGILEQIPQERFETLKASQISILEQGCRNLKEQAALWNRLAFSKDGDFNYIEKRIDGLNNLSYEDFISLSKAYLGRNNKKRIALLYEGKLQSPYAYHEINVPEIEELVTYSTKPSSIVQNQD